MKIARSEGNTQPRIRPTTIIERMSTPTRLMKTVRKMTVPIFMDPS